MLCTGQPLASDFTIFGVFGFVGFVASVLFLCWMRTAILAGGIAVVRSGFCSVFFAKDGEGSLVLFNGDWTIRSNSAWSQKNLLEGLALCCSNSDTAMSSPNLSASISGDTSGMPKSCGEQHAQSRA